MQLSIQVAAVRPEMGSGLIQCQTEAEAVIYADRIGVYVRNPQALHVQDFYIYRMAGQTLEASFARATAKAFKWADALAEHIGAPVESVLTRPILAREAERDPAVYRCTACGRPEADCSADPCAAVEEDRER